jgi:hypothetical protein
MEQLAANNIIIRHRKNFQLDVTQTNSPCCAESIYGALPIHHKTLATTFHFCLPLRVIDS